MISDRVLRAGLIGENIRSSLSPYLQEMLAKEKGIKLDYGLYDENTSLSDFVSKLRKSELIGFNITKPYKKSFFDLVDEVDSSASQVGAVNVLAFKNDKVIAYNTDYIGIYQALKRNGLKIKDRVIVIFGAGGASRSAVYATAKYGASKIIIVNRTYKNAEKIVRDMERFFESSFECFSYDDFRQNNKYDDFILINATSVGMKGFLEELILDDEIISGASFFVDMIYSPLKTKSIEFANEKGIKSINGLDMLFFQGIKCFEIWTGLEFSIKEQERLYKYFINYCKEE